MKRRLRYLLPLFVLLAMVGIPCSLVYREARQTRLNRALIASIKANDTFDVRTLLKQGANPNALDLPEDTRSFWQVFMTQFRRKPHFSGYAPSALIVATEHRTTPTHKADELVQALVKAGANVNARGNNGYTPLMASVADGNIQMVRFLLSRGAKVNDRDRLGVTPLMFAQEPALLTVLIDAGADVNAKCAITGFMEEDNGSTALMQQSRSGAIEPVRILLSKGADINATNADGLTALGCCAKRYKQMVALNSNFPIVQRLAKVIELLKKAGAKE